MKLHFEPNLDFQLQAIEAVCDLFGGQEVCRTEFTVTRDSAEPQALLAYAKNDLGIGNRLTLLDDEILKNLKSIQLRNGLPPSDALDSGLMVPRRGAPGFAKPGKQACPVGDKRDLNVDFLAARREFNFCEAFSRSIAVDVVDGIPARVASRSVSRVFLNQRRVQLAACTAHAEWNRA